MSEITTAEKECLITLVTPGQSDRVIRVFPAEHEKEKIWLDNTPGIERWEIVQRFIQLHASRFSPIPEPKPWHGDPKDLKTVTLRKEDIPLVKLENAVLGAPPKEAEAPVDSPQLSEKQWDERFNKLESTVNKLVDLLSTKPETTAAMEKRGPGRPKKIV